MIYNGHVDGSPKSAGTAEVLIKANISIAWCGERRIRAWESDRSGSES